MLKYSYTGLTCGYTHSGVSGMLTSEKYFHQNKSSIILSRVLINCGDSTQRFCSEHKLKLSKVSAILITSLAPRNISGLPGVILTLSSLGIGKIKLIGPYGLQGIIDNMTTFVNRR